MTRRELREHCFKLLFCTDFHPAEEIQEQMEQYFTEPAEDEAVAGGGYEMLHCPALDAFDGGYVMEKVERVMENKEELDVAINKIAEGWSTKRMGREELAILRLALYEIRHDEDVPEKVAINEAVELAKKYGGDDSASFVNGILAKLV